jgi:hypothetical protein
MVTFAALIGESEREKTEMQSCQDEVDKADA